MKVSCSASWRWDAFVPTLCCSFHSLLEFGSLVIMITLSPLLFPSCDVKVYHSGLYIRMNTHVY